MKKILILLFCLTSLNVFAAEKKTTFTKELFDKAQSDGKVVVVSSWIKYCSSCASQICNGDTCGNLQEISAEY